MRVAAVATGGLLGYGVGALRGRSLRKVLYSALGAGGVAAVVYPGEVKVGGGGGGGGGVGGGGGGGAGGGAGGGDGGGDGGVVVVVGGGGGDGGGDGGVVDLVVGGGGDGGGTVE